MLGGALNQAPASHSNSHDIVQRRLPQPREIEDATPEAVRYTRPAAMVEIMERRGEAEWSPDMELEGWVFFFFFRFFLLLLFYVLFPLCSFESLPSPSLIPGFILRLLSV